MPEFSGVSKKILQLVFRFADARSNKGRSLVVSRFKLTAEGCNLLAERFGPAIHDKPFQWFWLEKLYYKGFSRLEKTPEIKPY